ncbi:unnamed protein product [Rhodiola kirilowii]
MTTIRTVLKIVASKNWPLFQMDVNNAFLHGTLDEEVYMTLPPGHSSLYKGQKKVCRLEKSLYGLKQASRQWFSKFTESIESFGFKQSLHDYSLFTYDKEGQFLILLVYVDDVVLTGTSSMARSDSGIFINQRKYAMDLLTDAGMLDCKPSVIPMDTKHKLGPSEAELLPDPTAYRRLVGKLIYLTVTRPDLAYSVHILSQFMSKPTSDHLTASHRVLRYIKAALAQGLFFNNEPQLDLQAFCDTDWAACPISRRSLTGF